MSFSVQKILTVKYSFYNNMKNVSFFKSDTIPSSQMPSFISIFCYLFCRDRVFPYRTVFFIHTSLVGEQYRDYFPSYRSVTARESLAQLKDLYSFHVYVKHNSLRHFRFVCSTVSKRSNLILDLHSFIHSPVPDWSKHAINWSNLSSNNNLASSSCSLNPSQTFSQLPVRQSYSALKYSFLTKFVYIYLHLQFNQ